ncbi:unnamed protein product [Chondrus crispus]|uniref:Uncharacterized protein n=1 Tax=Chondrus crispus TaxID=2769 RepID=R7QGT7_CHOCR|nr:unnamed protein product [Chondrus crispus]CDF36958.1 unnamed protein product [Chondrus crispus]|eukprot:XP_005716777.1 unnamed protein product [Chondrus crispus]
MISRGGGLVTTINLDQINFESILFCVSRLNTVISVAVLNLEGYKWAPCALCAPSQIPSFSAPRPAPPAPPSLRLWSTIVAGVPRPAAPPSSSLLLSSSLRSSSPLSPSSCHAYRPSVLTLAAGRARSQPAQQSRISKLME